MATDGYDPLDLVELRVRGEFLDVVGLVTAVNTGLAQHDGNFEGLDRATKVSTEVAEQVNQQVNFGLAARDFKKLRESDESVEYRGVEAIIDEFDPQHPDAASTGVDRLTPLDEMDWYIVLGRSDQGFEAAGYPDRLDVERSMLMASFARQYARDLEEAAVGQVEEDLKESADA